MLPNSPAGRRPGVGPDGGDGLGVGAAWLGRVEHAAEGGSSPRSARSVQRKQTPPYPQDTPLYMSNHSGEDQHG